MKMIRKYLHYRKIAFALASLLSMVSCNIPLDIMGLAFGSSPAANERFAQSKAYNDANGFRSIAVTDNNYRFYVATDCHVSTSANGMSKFVSDYLEDEGAAPFALFLGDAMRGKDVFTKFLQTVAPIETSGRTLFCTPGNHDIYFGQWNQYIEAMKTSSYIFEVVTPSEGTDIFISLDSAEGTLGTSQREWLGQVLSSAKSRYRNIIVFTHTHFFKRDNTQGHTSNYNLEEGYDLEHLMSESNVMLVLTGHDHSFEETFFKNVTYYTLAAIEDSKTNPFYYIIDISSGSHRLTEVPISDDLTDYRCTGSRYR